MLLPGRVPPVAGRLPLFINYKTDCMSKLSKRHFWEWFKRHNKEYVELRNKSTKEARYWLNELNAHLRAYYKFFGFSMTWQDQQSTTLIITVRGKAIHFKKVEAFVATAPDIPGWKITALEDPMPMDFLLDKQIEDTGIDPRELYFAFANDNPSCANIIVYHPLCTRENEWQLLQVAHAAVYNLLGERAFGMELDGLQVANLSCADPGDVEKIEALSDCIGTRMSSIMNLSYPILLVN
jgi:hypothetical protein